MLINVQTDQIFKLIQIELAKEFLQQHPEVNKIKRGTSINGEILDFSVVRGVDQFNQPRLFAMYKDGIAEVDHLHKKGILGQGTFGKVRLAVTIDQSPPELIAVKIQPTIELIEDLPEIKIPEEIIAKEEEMLQVLGKYVANSVRTNEHKVTKHYTFMDFVEGIKVIDYVKLQQKSDQTNELTYIKLAREIILTVIELHQKKIVHGDLNFGNMLIDSHSKVHLIDFGYSGKLEDNKSYRTVYKASGKFDKDYYWAPECYHGKDYLESDIYTLGYFFQALGSKFLEDIGKLMSQYSPDSRLSLQQALTLIETYLDEDSDSMHVASLEPSNETKLVPLQDHINTEISNKSKINYISKDTSITRISELATTKFFKRNPTLAPKETVTPPFAGNLVKPLADISENSSNVSIATLTDAYPTASTAGAGTPTFFKEISSAASAGGSPASSTGALFTHSKKLSNGKKSSLRLIKNKIIKKLRGFFSSGKTLNMLSYNPRENGILEKFTNINDPHEIYDDNNRHIIQAPNLQVIPNLSLSINMLEQRFRSELGNVTPNSADHPTYIYLSPNIGELLHNTSNHNTITNFNSISPQGLPDVANTSIELIHAPSYETTSNNFNPQDPYELPDVATQAKQSNQINPDTSPYTADTKINIELDSSSHSPQKKLK